MGSKILSYLQELKMNYVAVILSALLVYQTQGFAQTDEELKADLRNEVRTFGQDADGDFGSSLTLVLLGEKAYPVLVEALSDPDPRVKANAASMLGLMGGEGNVPTYVLEALQKAQEDEDPQVRTSASQTLSQIRQNK